MKKRTKIIYITGGVGLILIVTIVTLFLLQFKFRRYTDKARGFSIEYPAEWEVMKDYGGAAVVFKSPLDGPLDVFHENVNIIVQDISHDPLTLREYSDRAIYQMEVTFMQNFELEESTAVATLGGYPAYKIIFTGHGPNTELRYYMTWIVLDKVRAYQVNYTALPSQFDKYDPLVERMLLSFKVLR